jgi:hypothetical protein
MKKYPRTYHCSFSPEVHSDDKTISEEIENELILNKEISISIKMDGGNTCIKPKEGVFARSHTEQTIHPTFDYIKNIHFYSKIGLLNENYYYFGENMYGKHSIEYTELDDYFYIFNILDIKNNEWLSTEEVIKEAKRCNFKIAPIIFNGKWGKTKKEFKIFLLDILKNKKFFGAYPEGFVIRNKNRIKVNEFSDNFIKLVRKGHVQTDKHWSKNWEKQELKK